ncbi:MAG: MBL fold metallo-hydrolase [Candidatus Levybacteria bacterium]|nr:MBL fold metallo-hydrolase [Candidatus Levybacteria bacterium]
MKIHFIGLSSFLIENNQGYRILIDPFNNAPEWSLGLSFPDTFEGKPLGSNLVLMSEPDADHAYAPGDWLEKAPPTEPNSNPFPDINLCGTIVYEWNGDLNIAWQYTVDGVRIAQLADNAHLLTEQQLHEIGKPDILFISASKAQGNEDGEIVRKNIEALTPKMIVWSHHIVPPNLPDTENVDELRSFFRQFFSKNASMSKNYKGEDSFMELCYILENAMIHNKEYEGTVLNETSISIGLDELNSLHNKKSVLFRKMLAKPKRE